MCVYICDGCANMCGISAVEIVTFVNDSRLKTAVITGDMHACIHTCMHAYIQVQRIGHSLWTQEDPVSKMLALSLQSRSAEVFGVDAHPGAVLSHAICLDHATGVSRAISHTCILTYMHSHIHAYIYVLLPHAICLQMSIPGKTASWVSVL
jgi:hypothetical protein